MIEMAVGVIGLIVVATVANWIVAGLVWLFRANPEFYRSGPFRHEGHDGYRILARISHLDAPSRIFQDETYHQYTNIRLALS
jgi:hypothetical protein